MDHDEDLLRRGLASRTWDLEVPPELARSVWQAVVVRRRRRRLVGLSCAAVVLVVAIPVLTYRASRTTPAVPGPLPSFEVPTTASASTTPEGSPLAGWVLGRVPAGYRPVQGEPDSTSTGAVGRSGFHHDGIPPGPGEVEVSVDLRRYQDAAGRQFSFSVLTPWQSPGSPPSGSDAVQISHDLAVSMYGPSASPSAVPGVVEGTATLVRVNATNTLVVIAEAHAQVIVLEGSGPSADDMVNAAHSLKRAG